MKEDNNTNGVQYWKSLDDLADTPAFKDWVKNEFPAGPELRCQPQKFHEDHGGFFWASWSWDEWMSSSKTTHFTVF